MTWLVLLSGVAGAWETRLDGTGSWRSIYLPMDDPGVPHEHIELADLALERIGIAPAYTSRTGGLVIVDLNASFFHPEMASDDVPLSPLERRELPAPTRFAGLPDYDYTLYDWINKSRLCPAIPAGEPAREECHVFEAWLGAGLNSSHFGSQAADLYTHYHGLALGMAERAREARESLGDDHPEVAVEREYLAMVYESIGQHFLQDRWSTGHMWERWNAPEFSQLPNTSVATNVQIGAISGLLHGSEAVLGKADPLCSPYIQGAAFEPMIWADGDGLHHGVGDRRLADARDGQFGAEYGIPDGPLAVDAQLEALLTCSASGYAEVVRALGSNPGGGFGAHGLVLAPDAPTGSPLTAACLTPWATNWSMYTALQALGGDSADIGEAAPLGRTAIDVARMADLGLIRLETEVGALVYHAWQFAKARPDGIDLASGGLPPLMGAQPGHYYDLPSYVDPASLDGLPFADPATGRDQRTFLGFFNHAFAEDLCPRIPAELDQLRGEPAEIDRETCAYLADLVFARTDPAYGGDHVERQRNPDGEPVDSLCAGYGVTATASDDTIPYHLHPGYVVAPEGRGDHAYESLYSWCDAVPVLDIDDAHVAGRLQSGNAERRLELTGRNLGGSPGQITAETDSGAVVALSIASWSDGKVRVDVPFEGFPAGVRRLHVTTADGLASRGRFELAVETQRYEEIFVAKPMAIGSTRQVEVWHPMIGEPNRVVLSRIEDALTGEVRAPDGTWDVTYTGRKPGDARYYGVRIDFGWGFTPPSGGTESWVYVLEYE